MLRICNIYFAGMTECGDEKKFFVRSNKNAKNGQI